MAIKLCIFDWAGTTVDFGCFAPINAFADAFKFFGIKPTIEEIRRPMGMLKVDHIKTMLEMDHINKQWIDRYHSRPNEEDVLRIYNRFEEFLFKDLERHSIPLENVPEVTDILRKKGIKIGSTTGYTQKMMDVVRETAGLNGYYVDYLCTPDQTGFGRPNPSMIYNNMKFFELEKTEEIIKIGDTISDIQEGFNAGVWSVGIMIGSSEMGLNIEEYKQMKDTELIEKIRAAYYKEGADFVIDEIEMLPQLIEKINQISELGVRPNGYKQSN